MAWKWNDIRVQLLRLLGTHQENLVSKIEKIFDDKKTELVGTLTDLADAADKSAELHAERGFGVGFDKGRASAFREVIDGVKPHGPRP